MATSFWKTLSSGFCVAASIALATSPLAASAAGKHAYQRYTPHPADRGLHAKRHGALPRSAGRGKYSGVRVAGSAGLQPLYSDGPGSSFGFHPGPGAGFRPYPSRAMISRMRRIDALRETMAIDQLTRGYGYGSPFHAGYYGPGGGPDTGFGRGY